MGLEQEKVQQKRYQKLLTMKLAITQSIPNTKNTIKDTQTNQK